MDSSTSYLKRTKVISYYLFPVTYSLKKVISYSLLLIPYSLMWGYSRCARYWLPAKSTNNQQPTTNNQTTYHYIYILSRKPTYISLCITLPLA
ncbi:MAG: hypothetical protein SO154_10725, partial [Prevotella sp.]|nr:hypothetical protein [Prevotella sp.]